MNNKFLIALEGNIGCGKEIFLKFLNKYFKDSLTYSGDQVCTWENEKLIKNFYKDQVTFSFLMEVTSITKKIKNLWNLIKNEKNEIIVSNRCPSSDKYCFLEALYKNNSVSEKEKETFCEMFDLMKMPKFDVIIYLKNDTDSCYERVISKRRNCEKKISYEFIKNLNICYEEWINLLIKNNVYIITIDMEKYSSLDGDEQIQEELLQFILKKLPKMKNYLRWKPYTMKLQQ